MEGLFLQVQNIRKIAMAAGIGKKQDSGSLPPERLLRKDGNQGQCSVTAMSLFTYTKWQSLAEECTLLWNMAFY